MEGLTGPCLSLTRLKSCAVWLTVSAAPMPVLPFRISSARITNCLKQYRQPVWLRTSVAISCCRGKAAPARNCLPRPFTMPVHVGKVLSSRSTAGLFPVNCWAVSFSAMWMGLLLAHARADELESLSWLQGGRCFWMKSGRCRLVNRYPCCGQCKKKKLPESATIK